MRGSGGQRLLAVADLNDLESGVVKKVTDDPTRMRLVMRSPLAVRRWAVPAGLTAAFAGLGLVLPAAMAGTVGVACAGWSILRKRRKAVGDVLKPSPEAYLYRAKKVLSPQVLANEIYTNGQMLLPYV
jgi:hypothetical protein